MREPTHRHRTPARTAHGGVRAHRAVEQGHRALQCYVPIVKALLGGETNGVGVLVDLPLAELLDRFGIEIAEANAQDQRHWFAFTGLQRRQVESIRNALAVKPVKTSGVGRARE